MGIFFIGYSILFESFINIFCSTLAGTYKYFFKENVAVKCAIFFILTGKHTVFSKLKLQYFGSKLGIKPKKKVASVFNNTGEVAIYYV